jgi:hypothetical protein
MEPDDTLLVLKLPKWSRTRHRLDLIRVKIEPDKTLLGFSHPWGLFTHFQSGLRTGRGALMGLKSRPEIPVLSGPFYQAPKKSQIPNLRSNLRSVIIEYYCNLALKWQNDLCVEI